MLRANTPQLHPPQCQWHHFVGHRPSNLLRHRHLWSKFIAMHNIPFQASDHVTKRLHCMFPDAEVAQKFSFGHTKTSAIIKEALGPHNLEKLLTDMLKFFSVLMDESNDKTDKSCITLVAFFILMKVMSVQDSLTCLFVTLAWLRICSEPSRNT